MCGESRPDQQTASIRTAGPSELQSRMRRRSPPPSELPAAGKGSDDWRRMIPDVYQKEQGRFIRYAAACLRRTRQMGIHLGLEPDDLVQDSVHLVLQGKLPRSVVGRMSIDGWSLDGCIIAVISSRCHALAKRERRRSRITRTSGGTDPKRSVANPVDADTEAETVLLKTRVRAAIDSQPSMQRQAVEQLDLLDRAVRELADELGNAENTLRNHRKRARQRLLQALATHRPLAGA